MTGNAYNKYFIQRYIHLQLNITNNNNQVLLVVSQADKLCYWLYISMASNQQLTITGQLSCPVYDEP